MIRKYIQKIIFESYEKDMKDINLKQKQQVEKMIHDAMIKNKLERPLDIQRFVYACKTGKNSNIDTEKIIEYKFKYHTGGPTGRPSNKKQIIINNITPEILKHSNFLRGIIYDKYNEIRGQSAKQRAENQVAAQYGRPAHSDMSSYQARGYGMISQDEFDEHVRNLTQRMQQQIDQDANAFARQYGLF